MISPKIKIMSFCSILWQFKFRYYRFFRGLNCFIITRLILSMSKNIVISLFSLSTQPNKRERRFTLPSHLSFIPNNLSNLLYFLHISLLILSLSLTSFSLLNFFSLPNIVLMLSWYLHVHRLQN